MNNTFEKGKRVPWRVWRPSFAGKCEQGDKVEEEAENIDSRNGSKGEENWRIVCCFVSK